MTPSFEGPKAKLARAEKHLNDLSREVLGFQNSDAYRIVEEIDAESGHYVWRMKIESEPMGIGVYVGDVVQNLRASLDHLIWQLALITTKHPKRTEFPIFEQQFPKSPEDKNCFEERGRQRVEQIPPIAQKLIESVQPYHCGESFDSDLWLLHQISIVDKHRFILVPALRPNPIALPLVGDVPSINTQFYLRGSGRPCYDGDVVLCVHKDAGWFDHEQQPTFSPQIALDVPGCQRIVYAWGGLNRIHKMISGELFPLFERFFTKCGPGF